MRRIIQLWVPSAFPVLLACQCLLILQSAVAQFDGFEYPKPEYNPYFANELFRRSYRQQDDAMETAAPVSKRTTRHTYTNPCDVEYKLVHLKDGVHTFWPRFYYEVHCKNGIKPTRGHSILDLARPPQSCGVEYLVCVQRYDEIHILKTRPGPKGAECYEIDTNSRQEIIVPSGCDCLQPNDAIEYVQ